MILGTCEDLLALQNPSLPLDLSKGGGGGGKEKQHQKERWQYPKLRSCSQDVRNSCAGGEEGGGKKKVCLFVWGFGARWRRQILLASSCNGNFPGLLRRTTRPRSRRWARRP